MKKIGSVRLNTALIGAVAGALLIYLSAQTKEGIKIGLELCAETLIPSLFPFLCIANIILLKKSADNGIFARAFSRIFSLPPALFKVFLFSLIGGYPLGALMTAELYKNGDIGKKQARRASLFCFCSGPAFCISAVGENMCSSKTQGIYLFISCVLSAVLTGLILRFWDKSEEKSTIKITCNETGDFNSAMEKSINSMLNMCAVVIIASAVVYLIRLSPINLYCKKALICALEVTNACAEVKESPALLAAVLSFGGISIFLQIKKYLDEINLPYFKYFLFRIISAVLSGGICFLINLLFPVSVQMAKQAVSVKYFSFSAPLSALLLFSFCVFILDNKKGKLFFEKQVNCFRQKEKNG